MKQFVRVLKNKERKKVNLSTIKNVRNDNYSDAMNFVEQTIFVDNIEMTEMIVEVNFKSRATKYQKIKQMKFKISFEASEAFEKSKKLAQMFKKQSNLVDITKQILNISIKIRLRELLEIFSKLSRQMFRDIIDEEMKTMFKKRKATAQMKIVKEKKVHVESVEFNFIESIYLKEIIARVAFFCLMYAVVCSTMSVSIDDIKIKTLFNNDVEINCMSKRLTDATQLFIRQKISIIIMNFIDERARFFDVCESIFVNIESIIISIFIFVIERSDHDLLFNHLFQRIACMNAVNMNDDSLKMILHSLNDEKRINFLKMPAKHINNKDEKFVFVFKTLNV